MKKQLNINLNKIKEAIKQAEANINFEKISIPSQKTAVPNKSLTLTKGSTNDKRPLE